MVMADDNFQLLNSLNVTTALLASLVFYLVYKLLRKPNDNLPPRVPSLPLVGSLPFLGKDVREGLKKMGEKYGEVITVQMGSRTMVVLNSYDAIKDAFVKHGHSFSGRPQDIIFIEMITKGGGVVSTEGETWREQRKFTHNSMRGFGVGKAQFEENILDEVSHLLKMFEQKLKTPFDPHFTIQTSVSNVICAIVFGKRFDHDDPKFQLYMDIMNRNFKVLGDAGILTAFPWVRHLPGDMFKMKELMRTSGYMDTEFRQQIADHRKTYDSDDMRDFIDVYLKEMNEEKNQNVDTTFNDEQCLRVIGDLFGAGTETTATTLRWAIVHMVLNPDIQVKVQKEIDDVIGGNALPSWADRLKMPYTEACIYEIQRMADIVPLGVPHSALQDVEFRGFNIPKGMTVTSNLYSVHRDAKTWETPYKFNPGHFLTEDGELYRKEKFIPFSMGRRVCLGESLAKMELFLFFVGMFQKFTFKLPDGAPKPDITGHIGITHMPKPYEIEVELR